ncbi:MAG: NAD-dependent epimerase/dehydratase [Chthoniobacterales bacterium]
MHILITGGAGYIGSVLTPMLLEQGFQVTVLDNLMFRQFTLANCCYYEGFRFVLGDVRNRKTVEDLLRQADCIIPLAALVGAPLCDRDPDSAVAINQDAISMLCRLASPDQRILVPITNSGYGVGEEGNHCTEESPLRPVSLYGRTKMAAESEVLARGNSISFRFATIFGMSSRMRLDLLVNDFVYRAYRDRAVVVFEGHFKRNYLHIRDACRAFLHGIANFEAMKGRAYNAGLEDANLSKLELCARIKVYFPEFTCLEAPIGKDPDQRNYIVSNARILATGFQPEWGLDRGILELKKGYSLLPASAFSNI